MKVVAVTSRWVVCEWEEQGERVSGRWHPDELVSPDADDYQDD